MKFYCISILFFFWSLSALSIENIKEDYKKVFPKAVKTQTANIEDKVSAEKNNNKILKLFNAKEEIVGFIRELTTTTGCNSACLPLVYTTFYSAKGELIKLSSEQGLTKINHQPFSMDDYSRLNLILAMAPQEFSKINHPKELTDALSGETLKVYKSIVVPGAAYSTLRIHLYNQETQNWIKNGQK